MHPVIRTIYGYIDGVLANTGKTFTSVTSDFSNALNFVVGATSDASKSYKWAGQIDNVRVWNKAMTARITSGYDCRSKWPYN